MNMRKVSGTLYLFLGDFVVWYGALWLSLSLRALHFPSLSLYVAHALPYTIIFLLSFLASYIFGLYDSRVLSLRQRIPVLIMQSQIFSVFISVFVFYTLPFFGVAPKLFLILNIIVTAALMFLWRMFGGRIAGVQVRESAILVGAGPSVQHVYSIVNAASYYPIQIIAQYDGESIRWDSVAKEIQQYVLSREVKIIIIDSRNEQVKPILPMVYHLTLSGAVFVDIHAVHEDISDKVPLALLGYEWVVEHASRGVHVGYDFMKRVMDLCIAFPLFLLSVPLYLPIAIAVASDGGPVFFVQKRIGKNNSIIRIIKFRTMSVMDEGVPLVENDRRITRVGKYLRMTRLDEIPQLFNVILGDLSLIGPRPEVPGLVEKYTALIPYYDVRHCITPGLSGWAQVHHEKPPQTVEETREKLAYDLYYLKHRSFLLDLKIALKTVYTLLSRVGV